MVFNGRSRYDVTLPSLLTKKGLLRIGPPCTHLGTVLLMLFVDLYVVQSYFL